MTTHVYHPDTHEYGLADNCPRCREHAQHPMEGLDDRNLSILLRRIQSCDAPRSGNEHLAMANIRDALRTSVRLREIEEGVAWT